MQQLAAIEADITSTWFGPHGMRDIWGIIVDTIIWNAALDIVATPCHIDIGLGVVSESLLIAAVVPLIRVGVEISGVFAAIGSDMHPIIHFKLPAYETINVINRMDLEGESAGSACIVRNLATVAIIYPRANPAIGDACYEYLRALGL